MSPPRVYYDLAHSLAQSGGTGVRCWRYPRAGALSEQVKLRGNQSVRADFAAATKSNEECKEESAGAFTPAAIPFTAMIRISTRSVLPPLLASFHTGGSW